MDWRLVHRDVGVNENSEIESRCCVLLEDGNTNMRISDNGTPELNSQSAKRALMDAAYKLEKFAIEMKHKAQKL